MAFVPLHNHSDYSLLDGASQISKIVERACDLGMESIALTDHGVMYGVLDLVKKCKEKGIKPIIGNEMYVINGSIDDPQPKKEKRYHLVVLAKNYTGYKNLVKLTTISHLNGMSCLVYRLFTSFRSAFRILVASFFSPLEPRLPPLSPGTISTLRVRAGP